jgi:hypothetical protein
VICELGNDAIALVGEIAFDQNIPVFSGYSRDMDIICNKHSTDFEGNVIFGTLLTTDAGNL